MLAILGGVEQIRGSEEVVGHKKWMKCDSDFRQRRNSSFFSVYDTKCLVDPCIRFFSESEDGSNEGSS